MLKVKDLMTIDPELVRPETPLRDVVAIMNRCNCRQLPVVEDSTLVGIITDRDVRLAVNSPVIDKEPLNRLAILDRLTAGECMTRSPATTTQDTPIYEVAGVMARHKFGALPVVEEGQLLGIITVTDLLNQMALRPEPGA